MYKKICTDCGAITSGQRQRCRSCGNRAGKLGEKNPNWKGGDGTTINLSSLHAWVKRRIPKPELCPGCLDNPAIDLANISQSYDPQTYTRDLAHWKWLCRRCHMREDGRMGNLLVGGRKTQFFGCTIEGCNNKYRSTGLCESHYRKMRRQMKKGSR